MWKKQKCKSDEVLSMRYATAKDLYQKLGMAVPDSLEDVWKWPTNPHPTIPAPARTPPLRSVRAWPPTAS